MRLVGLTVGVVALVLALTGACNAASAADDILARVKTAESTLKDFKADMVIDEASRSGIATMGEGWTDILKLQKGVVSYKKPDKIRYDGFAQGIKAAYIQNGYSRLVLATMIRHKTDLKNDPGKRQDTLDLGFLGSQLWKDNTVTVVGKDGSALKLKFDPKAGGKEKRHDMVWVEPKTLKVVRRQKFVADGSLRLKTVYSEFKTIGKGLPIATESALYNGAGQKLGVINYRNLKSNVGLSDSLFSLTQR